MVLNLFEEQNRLKRRFDTRNDNEAVVPLFYTEFSKEAHVTLATLGAPGKFVNWNFLAWNYFEPTDYAPRGFVTTRVQVPEPSAIWLLLISLLLLWQYSTDALKR